MLFSSHMGLMQIEVYCWCNISLEATTFVPTCTLYDGSPMTPALHPHMGDLLMALLWVATKKYLWDTWTMTTREKILMLMAGVPHIHKGEATARQEHPSKFF